MVIRRELGERVDQREQQLVDRAVRKFGFKLKGPRAEHSSAVHCCPIADEFKQGRFSDSGFSGDHEEGVTSGLIQESKA
jgi:hypothetical protein